MQWTTSPSDIVSVPSFSSPGGVLGADLALFLLILTACSEERVGPDPEVPEAAGEAGGDSVSARSLLGLCVLELGGSLGVSDRVTDSFTADSSPSTYGE